MSKANPEVPIQIHSPRAEPVSVGTVDLGDGPERVAHLALESTMDGRPFAWDLFEPMLITDSLRPATDDDFRRFLADCTLISYFADRQTFEFWAHDGFVGAIKFKSCTTYSMTIEPAPAAKE